MISTPQIERRRKFLKNYITLNTGKGLEIGPYDRPIVMRGEGDIKYLDYFRADELRQKKNAPQRVSDEVVELDYVIGGTGIGEAVDDTFDYVVASHVIEHVPNIIGWLKDLAKILTLDGYIFLAVPDKRYTFDFARPLSTPGQIIENFRTNKQQPSYADVFDALRYHKQVKPKAAWTRRFDFDKLPYTHDLKVCHQHGRMATRQYFDCHCNVFTCESFLQIMSDLQALSLSPFKVEAHRPCEKPFNDFLCVLKKV
ncbi:MAG: methyltransferase domain-containing protein [Deltaproteobacteria bacterium]|nr:methyltransferase domain-containing protein [Deltaproteobacteria bacterium]